jgi:hypothetical protein
MTDIRQEARAALDYREVWFIFSKRDEYWANLRIATFTKAMNRPHLELVVIHDELDKRVGVRVWHDIVESEGWFKVRKIEVPTREEILGVMELSK